MNEWVTLILIVHDRVCVIATNSTEPSLWHCF